MTQENLSTAFDEKAAPPPVLGAEAYLRLLEKLMGEGKGFGKTERVAAYLLHDLRIVTENETPSGDISRDVKVQPLYVVMDLKQWPNEYGRSLVMQDIMSNYAMRMVGEHDLNGPDFKGPGLWTSKQKSFDEDYMLGPEKNEHGRSACIYYPNPDAFRVCLNVDRTVTIPTTWGTWTIRPGGTLAVRESEVPGLAEALRTIHSGAASAQDALFRKDAAGHTFARFDVYGMEPGFLQGNYKPVQLKAPTAAVMASVASAPAPAAPKAAASSGPRS